MKLLRKILDKQEKHFLKGGKLEKLYPLFEASDTLMYNTGNLTKGPSHIRDGMDYKRMMMTVIIALLPAILFGLYNTGYQANLAIQGGAAAEGWRIGLVNGLGLGLDPGNIFACFFHGLLYFLPIYIVTLAVGGVWEVVFAAVRKHEIQEGFLVTSMLFPLILPPTIPLWQVAVGISFGVVIGKEVFGGVGMNIFNPALVGRVFLFFAYPAQISGDAVWVAADGVSKATPLAELADPVLQISTTWWDAFLGFIPGSIGETSVLACLLGAIVLIISKVGSWRTMISVVVGMVGMSLLLNAIGSATNPMFGVEPHWHLVLGGFAFGLVFMATDPVSSAMTDRGKYYYGLLIGILVVLVRVINPVFPEGMMLAILFGNLFAPLMDRLVVNKTIKRRKLRHVIK
ncbi:MAG: NADH:ubiquinone reductase (Na(+)-transporting) subunit B [bacterium]|nr:NADH:ubiquinone reductase (Na(+)-transporting) subunit B [bacterium]